MVGSAESKVVFSGLLQSDGDSLRNAFVVVNTNDSGPHTIDLTLDSPR